MRGQGRIGFWHRGCRSIARNGHHFHVKRKSPAHLPNWSEPTSAVCIAVVCSRHEQRRAVVSCVPCRHEQQNKAILVLSDVAYCNYTPARIQHKHLSATVAESYSSSAITAWDKAGRRRRWRERTTGRRSRRRIDETGQVLRPSGLLRI